MHCTNIIMVKHCFQFCAQLCSHMWCCWPPILLLLLSHFSNVSSDVAGLVECVGQRYDAGHVEFYPQYLLPDIPTKFAVLGVFQNSASPSSLSTPSESSAGFNGNWVFAVQTPTANTSSVAIQIDFQVKCSSPHVSQRSCAHHFRRLTHSAFQLR
jgi:hypothetical protein